MLKLFANGVYNFIVQPLPHIVVFLFALVWLVPCALAAIYRQRRKEFPMLMALYVIGLALLPVAFGRADPTHVFFNGIAIYLLSMVAISTYRRNEQIAWAVCVSCVLVWTAYVNIRFFDFETKQLLRATAQGLTHDGMRREAVATVGRISAPGARYLRKLWSEKKAPFDMARLKEIVGDAPVVTPYPVQLEIEEDLKRSGQYAPTFYCFQVAVLDQNAEEREIRELNAMQWALLPGGLGRSVYRDYGEHGLRGWIQASLSQHTDALLHWESVSEEPSGTLATLRKRRRVCGLSTAAERCRHTVEIRRWRL